MKRLLWLSVAIAALAATFVAMQQSPAAATPAAQAAKPAAPVQLGGPPKGTGSVISEDGEITPPDPAKFHKIPGYSPYAGRKYPERPYFGDEHVHTSWSVDAGGFGTTLGPEEATRFARGEEVVSTSGQPVKLGQPLDWVVIADHSDGMGIITELKEGNPELMADPTLAKWAQMMKQGPKEATAAVMEIIKGQATKSLPAPMMDPRFAGMVWQRNTEIAERYNEPGRFTAFIGFEWTSNYMGGDNLHRNIIYRDGKDKADQVLPFTTFQSEDPEDLWKWMAAWEEKTGGRMLAIPHNGNMSNGRMFAFTTLSGAAIGKAYAEERQRREPLYEIIQMKGQGEAHPAIATSDEFVVNYELWDKGNLTMTPKQPGQLQYEYLRDALANGLALQQQAGGVNPFKYGIAGGTDTHNALAAAEENNFFSKFPIAEPSADRWNEDVVKAKQTVKGWEVTSAGYTAVWATGNTREELFDAMMRRETYGTSGPHIIVRFFGGWDFTKADATRMPAAVGYAKGVPMGGDLPAAPAGKKPTFLVAALKDAHSGNLDRIQIIKGWLGADGKPQQRIYDVVWGDADKRKIVDGKLQPVGNTVDTENATFTNTIGAPELVAVWTDPDFDPRQRAVYYARVLEIPTPRWTGYDHAYFKNKVPPEVPLTTVERAYTSPIWYDPR